MTPEEKAVVEAAIAWRNGIGQILSRDPLAKAVDRLIYSCPDCNRGGHTCPGDDNPIGHTATDCGEHEEDKEADKRARRAGFENAEDAKIPPPIFSHASDLSLEIPPRGILTYPCFECLDDQEDPAPWCECHPGETCKGPCKQRAHYPWECPNLPKTWEPATLLYTLAGDTIRIGTDESKVLRSSSGAWHANVVSSVLPSGKVWDKIALWEHTELQLDLSANPGFRKYPPNLPCEILCTPERKAVLLLMTELDAKPVQM